MIVDGPACDATFMLNLARTAVALSTGERVTIGPFGVVRFFVLTGYLLYRGVKVSFRIPGGVIGTGPRSSIDRDTAVAASSLVG